MTNKTDIDDATDRRLRLLIGLVAVAAVLAALGMAVCAWTVDPGPLPSPAVLAMVLASVIVANHLRVYVRIRSTQDGTSWAEVSVLIGLCVLPAPWVVLCSATGMALLMIVSDRAPLKRLFAIAKDVLTTATAGAVFIALGVDASTVDPPFAVLALTLAMLAFLAVDHLVYIPVVATASRMSFRHIATSNLDVRLIGYAARLLVAIIIGGVLLFGANTLLLLAFPLVVGSMHFWQKHRQGTRQERESWQRLAEATDALNAVDLTVVLHSAASRAAVIFSAAEAQVSLAPAGTDRVVIGSADQIRYDGPEPDDQTPDDEALTTELIAHDESFRVGTLRLRFGGPIKLTEFEQYKLKTFSSALCTAIRNAQAYAELARLNEQNAHAATHDPLTGLANRRALYERVESSFRTPAKDGIVALLLIDLNHFKEVNDTLGHAAGDAVLCEVARRLCDSAVPGDLVARLGGDEFAVLLVDLPTPALATHRAEAMLGALGRSLEVEGMQITVEAAGGIALAPGSGGVNELMRRADIAMYQAKRAGKRTTVYAHARDTADVSRLMLGGELQRAVAEHEFIVDFQPIVDLGTGAVIAVEALTRWQHPEHGRLTPLQFLEMIERSGQLPAFADVVLDQSLAASNIWRASDFDLPIAVNVSPRSLLDPHFPERVLAALRRHGMPPGRLVLELAETLTISQLDVVGRALADLSQAGVRLALDDFGTGVSPLSVLSHIPVHQLKIDREFVGAVETSSEAAAVIRSTVDLARSLHLTVIAEGVESEPQRHALWELGCLAGQGHLFARAMSAAKLLATLQRGSAGLPATLASPLHDGAAVVRLPRRRPPAGQGRSALPHLPA